jgi:hypothetical protein
LLSIKRTLINIESAVEDFAREGKHSKENKSLKRTILSGWENKEIEERPKNICHAPQCTFSPPSDFKPSALIQANTKRKFPL